MFIALLVLTAANLSAANAKKSYYFQRAEEAYQQENYDEALRFGEAGVKENPKDGYCWAMLAELYSKRANGQYAKALEAADKAIKLVPKKDIRWQAFMICIKGDVYYKVEDYANARTAYRQAMLMDKERTNYLIEYADVCYVLGDYAEGVRWYEDLLEKEGSPAYVYAELAKGYYKLGRIADAKNACGMAIVLTDDENYNAHHILAQIAIDEGEPAKACREEARAIALENVAGGDITDTLLYLCHPLMDAAVKNELQKVQTDAKGHLHAANYYILARDGVRAFYHMQKAEQYGTEHKDLLQGYSYVYDMLGETSKAIEATLEQMASDSLSEEHKPYYYNRLGGLYQDNGQTDKAIEYRLLEHAADPNDGDVYRMLGRAYIMQGQLETALAYMDSAIMTATEYMMPTCLFNRGEVKRRMGDEEGAQSDFREALTYRNSKNSDRSSFIYAEALLGNRAAVNQYADSVLALHKTVAVYHAYRDLMNCYALLKDKKNTLRMLNAYCNAGFRSLPEIRHFYRWDWLQDDADFQALLDKWEAVRTADVAGLQSEEEKSQGVTELPFTMEGGVCKVKCTINSLPLYFVFDTGASEVSISSVEANFMLKNGYLAEADFLGKQNYVTATGEIHEGTVINLREVRVGDVVLHDVKASVVKSQHAPLLLGQSVFRRFGTLQVDNKNNVIRFIQK